VLGAASALAALGSLLVARFAVDGPYAPRRAPFDPRQVGHVLRDRPVLLAIGGYLGHMWELYAVWAWLAVFLGAALGDARAASPRWIAFFAIGVAGCAGALAAGWLADRLGRTAVTIGAMAISGACCLASAAVFGAPAEILVAFGLVWGASAVADSAQFSAAVSELADPAYMGTALTLQTSFGFALTLVTIWLLPYVAAAFDWRFAFLVLVPGPVFGCVSMALLRRHPAAARLAAGRR
jgi:predicted MFS family arabinose efflux permease